MKRRSRLDEYLLAQGYFSSLREAQAWILAGKILVNGSVCSKVGTLLDIRATVNLRGLPPRYSSRGGYKLEKALHRFGVNVEGRVALDAGAATGGFTDCLLQHGVRHVYAVDVGFGQLKGKLANNPKVTNWERVNISDLSRDDFDQLLDLCTVDLSFLSLTTALPILRRLFLQPYAFICLIKPLFEGLSHKHRDDPQLIATTLSRFFESVINSGIAIVAVTVSPVLGTRGTIEFLMYCHENLPSQSAVRLAEQAVSAMADEPPLLEAWYTEKTE